jgi:acyl-CoA hydrolase
VEARLLESVFPTDTNPMGTLFGGTLVSWMDKAAGFAATRRAQGNVVTAAIDDISFRVPIHQGDLVQLLARVVSVGRTSMRVRVEVHRESPTEASVELCTVGHFTMVAMDAEGRPRPVPALEAEGQPLQPAP